MIVLTTVIVLEKNVTVMFNKQTLKIHVKLYVINIISFQKNSLS